MVGEPSVKAQSSSSSSSLPRSPSPQGHFETPEKTRTPVFCRHNTSGTCHSASECVFAYGVKELPQGRPTSNTGVEECSASKASTDLDAVDDRSHRQSWFGDAGSDIENCSTDAEVTKARVKLVSSDSSEGDYDTGDDGSAMSREYRPAQTPEERQTSAREEKTEEDSCDGASHSAMVHRWDADRGQWVLDYLDITEELPADVKEQEQTAFNDSGSVKEQLGLEAIVPKPRRGRWGGIRSTGLRLELLERTPLRPSAAMFVPRFSTIPDYE